jgi:quercetin dioxygenase-like cupin family protein
MTSSQPQPPPIVRTELVSAALGAATAGHCRLVQVELAPGQAAGVHRHPCHVVGYVVSGTIRYQLAGGPEQILHAGNGFHEPIDQRVDHFDNASETEQAVFLACYLLPTAETALIEMLSDT